MSLRALLGRGPARDAGEERDHSPIRSSAELRARIVPTEYERRSCAGTGPRLRAMTIAEHRKNPLVRLGDEMSAACYINDAKKVQELLDQGVDPNHIHFEVNCQHPLNRTTSAEVARVLLAHPKIDVNARDMNDYSILCNMVLHNRDNVDLVAAILEHKDLDVHASGPLQTAARFASLDMIRMLLDHPALDLNDACGLLHCAVRRTDSKAIDVAGWLMQQEALDINLRRKEDGSTALMNLSGMDSLTIEIGENEAVKKKQICARQVEMLKMLLPRADLQLNAVDAHGRTALHRFSAAGRSDLVQLLLKDPRCLPSLIHHDADGRTPLDAVTAEKNRERKPWDPAPKQAKYDEVIALLTRAQEEKKAELLKLVPAELGRHPGTWSMAVDSLMN